MRFKLLPLILVLLVGFYTNSFSQEPEAGIQEIQVSPDYSLGTQWGLGLKLGIHGIGVEVVKGFGDRINARLGYSYMSFPLNVEQSVEGYTIGAEAKLKLGGASFLIDYYPVKNYVHLTAGIFQNITAAEVSIIPLSGYPFGDLTIPSELLGTISASLSTEMPVYPYIAIGFGNTLSRLHRVSFNFEIGGLYQGAPIIDLEGSGMLTELASDHNAEVLSAAFEPYKWLPLISLQLTFKIL